MFNFKTRKTIALVSIAILAFTVVFCIITGKSIPESVNAIITAFIGYIGYYFGKSTALEGTPEDHSGK